MTYDKLGISDGQHRIVQYMTKQFFSKQSINNKFKKI